MPRPLAALLLAAAIAHPALADGTFRSDSPQKAAIDPRDTMISSVSIGGAGGGNR